MREDIKLLRTNMQDLRTEVREDIKLLTVGVDNRLTRLEERLSK